MGVRWVLQKYNLYIHQLTFLSRSPHTQFSRTKSLSLGIGLSEPLRRLPWALSVSQESRSSHAQLIWNLGLGNPTKTDPRTASTVIGSGIEFRVKVISFGMCQEEQLLSLFLLSSPLRLRAQIEFSRVLLSLKRSVI